MSVSPPSFDEVFSAEFASLHNYVARRVGTSHAEELTAATFAIAYRRWEDRDPSRPTRPWLYGIAANLLKHHWRTEKRMLRAYVRMGVDSAPPEDEPLGRVDAEAMRPVLAAALTELRQQEREILLLWAWAEMTEAEIAESLQLPLGTVKSRLSRARQHTRNHLGTIGKVEGDTPTAEEKPHGRRS